MAYIFTLMALAAAGEAFGQESAADVTPGQVVVYQAGMDKGCRDAGHRKGVPQEKVDGFCNGMMETLGKSMSSDEWKQAYFHSSSRRDRDDMLVLRPHFPKVQARRGI